MIEKLKNAYKLLNPNRQKLILDYKVELKPREHQPHPLLLEIINRNRKIYNDILIEIKYLKDVFHQIKTEKEETNPNEPSWNNGYLPGLDIVSLYTIIQHFQPNKYIEVGSGNSTKVAKKSILDKELKTEITTIDPFPRANIDHLSDQVIRKPFEQVKDYRFIIDVLEKNDILFIDNSHRCLPNSDATVFFLEVLPYLKKGVIVHIHDIYLPYDYPQFMCDRFYSEQYILAAFILANPERYKTILPNFFISEDKELSMMVKDIWDHPNTQKVEKHGGSFWLQIS